MRRSGETHRERFARVRRVYDAIIPQPRRRVRGLRLAIEGVAHALALRIELGRVDGLAGLLELLLLYLRGRMGS